MLTTTTPKMLPDSAMHLPQLTKEMSVDEVALLRRASLAFEGIPVELQLNGKLDMKEETSLKTR
jgi:hypothetical protein